MADLSGIGSAVGGVAGAVGAIANLAMSAEQLKRAQQLRDQAKGIQAPEIAPQFLEADRIAQWRAQNGMPGLNNYVNNANQGFANATQSASGVSGSGANTLAAISALYGQRNKELNGINAQDAQYRGQADQGLIQSKQELGNQVNHNRGIQLQKQNALQQGANQLENASSANKVSGTKQIVNSLGQGLGGVVGALAGKGDGTDNTTAKTGGSIGQTTATTNPSWWPQGYDPSTPQVQASAPVVGYQAAMNAIGQAPTANHPAYETPENITALQQHLAGQGSYQGPIDGNYNKEMEDALGSYDAPYNTNLASVAPIINQ